MQIQSVDRNDPNSNLCLTVTGDEYKSGSFMTRATCGTMKTQNWRIVHKIVERDEKKVEEIFIKDPSLDLCVARMST